MVVIDFLRTAVFAVLLVIALLLAVPAVLLFSLFGVGRVDATNRVVVAIVRFMLVVAGVRVRVVGAPVAKAPTLFIGNHTSLFDVLLAIPVLPHPLAFISKIENKIPVLGWLMKQLGCVFLDRSNLKQQVKQMMKAQENMRGGISYLVFPEGTRSKDGALLAFKAGTFRLSTKTGAGVQPIGFVGARDVMRKGSLLIRGGNVTLNIGEILRAEDLGEDTNEIASTVRKKVQGLVEEISGVGTCPYEEAV